jgi:lipase chaperone LimK
VFESANARSHGGVTDLQAARDFPVGFMTGNGELPDQRAVEVIQGRLRSRQLLG